MGALGSAHAQSEAGADDAAVVELASAPACAPECGISRERLLSLRAEVLRRQGETSAYNANSNSVSKHSRNGGEALYLDPQQSLHRF